MVYWGSRCIFHTVCWGVVGFEWGTTSVNFWIIYVCFIPRILPVFSVAPKYQHRFFVSVKNIFWKTKLKSSKKSLRVKSWNGFVGQILIELETSSIWCFPQSRLWCSIGDNFSKHTLYFLSWSIPYSPSPFCGHVMFYVCMMTSSNGNIFRVTGPLCGKTPVTGDFPSQRPVTRSFDVFFDLRLNKR